MIVFGSLVLINQKAFLKCIAVSFSSKLLLLLACPVAGGGACFLSVGGVVLPSSAVSLGLYSDVGPLLTLCLFMFLSVPSMKHRLNAPWLGGRGFLPLLCLVSTELEEDHARAGNCN